VLNVVNTLFSDVMSCCLVNTQQHIKSEEYLSTVDTVLAVGNGCEDGRWMELA
jgi:hypothetical protein